MIFGAKEKVVQNKSSNADLKERHLRLISENKKGAAQFFYKISNPDQLAKVGRSYLEDYKKGIKSFAFSSTSYKSAQQRTVLGLASYFDQLFNMKILIVSDNLSKGVFEELLIHNNSEKNVNCNGQEIKISSFYHHFDFLSFSDLIRVDEQSLGNHEFMGIVKQLLDNYDIIFWDTPIIDSNESTAIIFSHIVAHLQSITLVVSPVASTSSSLTKVKEYFSNYGVDIKGVIFDTPHTD